jgi:methylmalonyl-CoA mutase
MTPRPSNYARDLGDPGEYPFARGVYADMYRGCLWTRREVCGFGSPQDTNRRLRFQVEQGVSGLSVIDDESPVWSDVRPGRRALERSQRPARSSTRSRARGFAALSAGEVGAARDRAGLSACSRVGRSPFSKPAKRSAA